MIKHAPYEDRLAAVYDLMYPQIEIDTAATLNLVERLRPAPARVLELGVGTGRIAIPLAQRGYEVHGIDGSTPMLEQLGRKDPEGRVSTQLADFTSTITDREYDLILIVLNTFFSAVTREQQISCLRGVHKQLAPGGRFVIEVFEPAPFHGLTQSTTSVRHLGTNAVMLDVVSVDRSHQLMVGVHTILDGGVPESVQHIIRYVFPSELDLLAELCGLSLVNRWGDFTGQPFTATSHRHVSVYAKAAEI